MQRFFMECLVATNHECTFSIYPEYISQESLKSWDIHVRLIDACETNGRININLYSLLALTSKNQ